jgi:hypothetical protein
VLQKRALFLSLVSLGDSMKNTFLTWSTGPPLCHGCGMPMLALAASLGMFQIIMRFVWSARRVDRSADSLQPDLDGLHGHSGSVSRGAMVSVDVLYRWSPPRVAACWTGMVALAALLLVAGHHLVGLGLCAARQRADGDRAGGRVHVLGLPGAARGRRVLRLGIIGNLLDPQRMELETAQ